VRSARGLNQPIGPPEEGHSESRVRPGSRCFETADLTVAKTVVAESEDLAGDGDLCHLAPAPTLDPLVGRLQGTLRLHGSLRRLGGYARASDRGSGLPNLPSPTQSTATAIKGHCAPHATGLGSNPTHRRRIVSYAHAIIRAPDRWLSRRFVSGAISRSEVRSIRPGYAARMIDALTSIGGREKHRREWKQLLQLLAAWSWSSANCVPTRILAAGGRDWVEGER
jgi:hypothetical protein